MTQPQPAPYYPPTPPAKRSKLPVIIVLVIVAIALVAGGSYAGTRIYQASQQPNIQATAVSIGQPVTDPRLTNVVNDGRVSNSGSFTYTTTLPGTYSLVFDNSFSTFSSKSVSVAYTVAGATHTQSFAVSPGTSKAISLNLSTDQTLSGTFTIAGGSGNDVDFSITASTCTETVSVSFTLVNPGQADGFATVHITADGQSQWSNRYLVPHGQQVPGNGSVTLTDCNTHTFNVVVSSQEKA